MIDFNEILARVSELTDEEIASNRQSALDEFDKLKDAEATEENVARMTEIADFLSALKEEQTARQARADELAAEAADAASRVEELTATPEEEVEEEVSEQEDPVQEEDTEFSEKPVEDEVDEEEEVVVAEEEAPVEVDVVVTEDEDKAETEEDEEKEEKEESDQLFSDNTEEINVATTPEELSVQDAPEPKSAGLDVSITAGADIPGIGLGAQLDNMADVAKAFSARLHAIGTRGSGNGEQHTVATFNLNFPDDRKLVSGDRVINENRMDAVASPEAVVAAGGICAPLPVDEELLTFGSTNRPVRDALPRFNAERGGVIYLTPPTIADVQGAVTVWTLADDYAAIGADLPADMAGITKGTTGTSAYPAAVAGTSSDVTGPVKPCIRITCGEEIRAYVDAIPQCFTVGNMQARAYPELIEKHLELAMVWQARFAEQRLLTRIGNLSTKVTTKATHGAARDFLGALSLAVAGYRSRHRLDDATKLRAILPNWFRDAIRADLLLQLAGDGQEATFGLADATIDRWISERGVNVTWTLDGEDGQIFGEQDGEPTLSGASVTPGTPADLNAFPDEIVWYLFPEGGFVFLDGGTLDLGIVRDSALNSKNDYQIFVETFEGVIKRAPETFRVTTPLNIVGATTGTVDPVLGS